MLDATYVHGIDCVRKTTVSLRKKMADALVHIIMIICTSTGGSHEHDYTTGGIQERSGARDAFCSRRKRIDLCPERRQRNHASSPKKVMGAGGFRAWEGSHQPAIAALDVRTGRQRSSHTAVLWGCGVVGGV